MSEYTVVQACRSLASGSVHTSLPDNVHLAWEPNIVQQILRLPQLPYIEPAYFSASSAASNQGSGEEQTCMHIERYIELWLILIIQQGLSL